MRRARCTGALAASVVLIVVGTPSVMAAQARVEALVHGTASSAHDVSADGSVVVGQSDGPGTGIMATMWTPAGAFDLGRRSPIGGHAWARGVSGDGTTVVGDDLGVGGVRAFRVTPPGAMTMVLPHTSNFSEARAASHDGSVIVGIVDFQAFRWSASEPDLGLGLLPDGRGPTTAEAVSADGSVVVGSVGFGSPLEAFVWTKETGAVGLGDFPGGAEYSLAADVSADGRVVVGYGFDADGPQAFRWTSAMGLQPLGHLKGPTTGAIASGVSGDGSLIVGSEYDDAQGRSVAFIWDEQRGMRSLKEALASEWGLDVSPWHLAEARAVSADGTTIVGQGYHPVHGTVAFKVMLPEPGLISVVSCMAAVLLHRRR